LRARQHPAIDGSILSACFVDVDLIHMDEFVEELLTEERIFDTILPRIQVKSNPCAGKFRQV